MRPCWLGLVVLLAGCGDLACGSFGPRARPQLVAQLFMGRGGVSEADWTRFSDEVITKAFPDGFTVLDAAGQWRGPDGISRENTKVLWVAGADDARFRAGLSEVSEAYKARFHQISVGEILSYGCAAF